MIRERNIARATSGNHGEANSRGLKSRRRQEQIILSYCGQSDQGGLRPPSYRLERESDAKAGQVNTTLGQSGGELEVKNRVWSPATQKWAAFGRPPLTSATSCLRQMPGGSGCEKYVSVGVSVFFTRMFCGEGLKRHN